LDKLNVYGITEGREAGTIGIIVVGVAVFFVLAQLMDGAIAFLICGLFVIIAGVTLWRWRAKDEVKKGLGLTDDELRRVNEDMQRGDREAALQHIASAQERQSGEFKESTGVDVRDITPVIGSDISWADIVNHALRVLEFDRAGTVVDDDDQVQAESPSAPYGYLLVESPILNQEVLLPITHAFDFLLATTVFDDPELTEALAAQQTELLVTYSPKELTSGGLSGSPHHVPHYVLTIPGALDSYYSADEDAHMAKPEPQELFGPFVYEGPTSVCVRSELGT
jgi:hypothetical protein